ncbi:MAG: CDP-alcohol phosphatidyltransferase family protein [Lentisphaerae bacterium]|nr:CDP-alcohol phosphatidyltransferase family protein [Lentisphaerota bacterium]
MTTTAKNHKGEKPGEFFVITALFSRRLAYPLALLCRRAGLSANAVTILGGMTWVLSVPTVLLAGRLWSRGNTVAAGWVLALSCVMWNMGYILDVVDGSLARMTDSSSSGGYFLDYSFHLIFHPMFLCSVGLFLFMVTDHLLYPVLALLSTCSGWGVSFHAKEHVLCEHIAKNEVDPAQMTGDQRYRIYIDSIKTKTAATEKTGRGRLTTLIRELFCFPGIYAFVTLVIVADLLLVKWLPRSFFLLQLSFIVLTVVPLARMPFRLRREFRTLEFYDEIR